MAGNKKDEDTVTITITAPIKLAEKLEEMRMLANLSSIHDVYVEALCMFYEHLKMREGANTPSNGVPKTKTKIWSN